MYLVMALAGRTRTAAAGAKAVNELVNVADFFCTQVAPDIQSTDANLVRTFRTSLGQEPACSSSLTVEHVATTHCPLPDSPIMAALYCFNVAQQAASALLIISSVIRSRRCCGRMH